MTCIVGFIDKKNGVAYIGGDSCASNWIGKSNIEQKKVFKLKDTNNAIIGFSGSIRDLNILTYATGLIDKRDEPNIDDEYIITKLIPRDRKSTRLNSSHANISYAVFCLKKKS